jgi:hypothetical protein
MKTPNFFSSGLAVTFGLLAQLTHTQAQHSDDFLVIEVEPGWSIIWDGNDGDHFDPVPWEDGGAQVPDNLALASNGAVPFGSSELDPARFAFHVIPSLNNGTYGNQSSWISADGDEDKFVGINLGGQFVFGRIAWGRDNGNGAFDDAEPGTDSCGGQCDDRWGGDDPYTLQITTVPNPDEETPDSDWETIGTFEYIGADGIEPGEGFTPWLRHEYEITRTDGNPTVMTGVRIIVPSAGLGGGTAIDEIEVYGPNGDPRFFFNDVNQINDRPEAQTLNIDIANRGATKTLNIASATLTGDPAFTLTSFPSTVEPLAQGEFVVAFDPQGKVGRYLAEIAVVSDDEFFPESTIPIVIQVEHANGLIAHYPMDETEGDQLVDASGNNYHGTFVTAGGAVMLGADPLASGTAVAFSGDLAYAEIPADVGFPLMQTFSVSMWVNFDPSGEGNFSSLFSKGVEGPDPFAIIANVGGPLQFFSAGTQEDPTEAVITSGQTHHVVITHEDKNGPKEFGESEARLYLDGELVFEIVESDGFDDRNPSPIQIGATAGQFGMIGSVDDVQIYQVEMTPENVIFLRDNPGDVLPGLPIIIRPADGFAIDWDGNDGEHFDPTAPPDGALVPDNLALSGTPFSSSDLGPELNIDFHRAVNLNDGTFGNSNSWISASGDENPFVGITLERRTNLMAVAWGRDNGNGAVDDSAAGTDACGGQCDDRAGGVYTLQVTTVTNPDATTPEDDWTTVGIFDYRDNADVDVGGAFTSFLRHEYAVSRSGDLDLLVTGVRLLVPIAGLSGGTAIDELEVYGVPVGIPTTAAEGFAINFDGNEGDRIDGATVPDNAALASNGAIPFTSGDLGPELNIGFHIVDNVNDGLYGNSNSWIAGSADDPPFLGVNLGRMVDITSVAWGRDNLNQFSDRSPGVYTLQVTTADNPSTDTPDTSWTTVGTFDYDNAIGVQIHLRHEFQVSQADGSPIPATGVRLLTPSTANAVDEFEVNPMRPPEPDIASVGNFGVTWDRNDGDHFDATPPPDGALVPNNLALASNGAVPFASGELGPTLGIDFHVAANLNDGFYGNANSWIGAGEGPFFAGVNLGGSFEIAAIAWGRDNGNGAFDDSDPGADACGGQCDDRWAGVYELQITNDANPDGTSNWTTVATITYSETDDLAPGDGFTAYLRHEYAIEPVLATGVRILTPDAGTAIDEIEVYGLTLPPVPDLVWDGTDGEFFDPVPPVDGSLVPDNLALSANGATAFASGSLGADRGLDFHLPENLNDGFFGNSNSWIGSPGDTIYAAIDLGGLKQIGSIAWGRDNGNGAFDDSDAGADACGGQCDDRWQGTYTVQVTTDANVSGDSAWRAVGMTELSANEDVVPGGGFTGYLRHGYSFAEGVVNATGVRIVVSNPDIAIDEIEIYEVSNPQLIWDGTDGDFFDPTPPPGGSLVPDNFALPSNGATAFASGSLGADRGLDFHLPGNLNDGFFGNSNSWIGSPGDIIYAAIDLGSLRQINAVAWGRDNGNGAVDDSDPGTDACGGQCDDRWQGTYIVQVTTDATVNGDSSWRTVGEVELTANEDTEIGGGLTGFLRHVYTFEEGTIDATGIRIVVSNPGTAIDEIEVYGPSGPPLITPEEGFAVAYDGNDGVHFDAAAPPEGALVPDNLALASNGATPFSSSDLGPELGIDFHVGANVNDGTYGNSNSWISASGDANPFIGVSLGSAVDISGIAWGRDNGNGAADDSDPGSDACGGQCDDRSTGVYTLQITTTANPNADTPDNAWMTVATFDYTESLDVVVGEQFTTYLRHEYQVMQADGSPVRATGVRLLVPAAGLGGGTAIDELEVYSAMPTAIASTISLVDDNVTIGWIGEVGARYFVEFSETMEADQWQILPGADTVDAGPDGVTSVMDTITGNPGKRFYRVGTR